MPARVREPDEHDLFAEGGLTLRINAEDRTGLLPPARNRPLVASS
jgi:hypothetical protein